MSYTELIILFIVLIVLSIWILSELMLFRCIKKSKNYNSLWLVLNIVLPIIGFIIYKLTHKNIDKQ